MSLATAAAVSARAAAPAAPSQLGRWVLVRLLGAGAVTRVYRARPAESDDDAPADYALKTPLPELAHEGWAAAALQREAHVAQRVSHPHLVSVLSARVDRPPFYLVMPFYAGATLRERLRGGAMPAPRAFWIVRQTLQALQALHGAGWVHGDVKPANVHLSPQGRVTLLDLGFAQPMEAAPAARPFMGTAAYAAPECARPEQPLTSAADLYGLGVTLYEMLTGRPPFAGDQLELLDAHARRTPADPRRLAPHLPFGATRLLQRLLAKDPLRRPTTDDTLAEVLALEVETFSDWRADCA